MSSKTFMTLREAATRLGVHESTVRRYADRGVIKAVRLPSGVRRLHRDDVEALAASPTRPPGRDFATLVAEQGVRPFTNAAAYAAPGLWESDEKLEAFLAMTYEERDRDR